MTIQFLLEVEGRYFEDHSETIVQTFLVIAPTKDGEVVSFDQDEISKAFWVEFDTEIFVTPSGIPASKYLEKQRLYTNQFKEISKEKFEVEVIKYRLRMQ